MESQVRPARIIHDALLKKHGHSLGGEALRTLIAEIEAIINSCPLTVEALSDASSKILLSLRILLIMKKVVKLTPPGVFDRLDVYSKRRWRRVQHIASEFWSRWRKKNFCKLYKPDKTETCQEKISSVRHSLVERLPR